MAKQPMRVDRRALAGLALAALAGGAEAQAPLVLATSTPGGGLANFGVAMIAELARAEPALSLLPRNTAGSAENVALLRDGAVALAIVAGDTATDALAQPEPPTILAALYGTPVMFVVRADAPYADFAALRGRPVLWGARSSNFVVMAR